jgi:molybdate transport system substrate-binding protein
MPARRTMRSLTVLAAILPLALVLVGCATSGSPGDSPQPTETLLSGQVTVLAASSLSGTLAQLATEFEEANPNVDVTISYGGSSALAEQIIGGAPAAIFAAASTATMQSVADAGLTLDDPVVFARNVLEIAVPAGNPGQITGLAALADPERTIALCAPEVPCGAAAVAAFERAGLAPAADTLEPDVKSVLTKVKLGEVDAGLVYRTDVLAAGDEVEGIELSDAEQVATDDVIARVDPAGASAAARAFLAFLLSDHARQVFADAGFQAP